MLDYTLKDWIMQMDESQKAIFVDGLFQIISQQEYTKLSELSIKSLTGLVKTYETMEDETRKILVTTLKSLIKLVEKNAKEEIKNHKIFK
jgi:hypothetical protein